MAIKKQYGKTFARVLGKGLLSILLTAVFAVIVYLFVSSQYPQVADLGGAVHFTDFTYYLENVKQFWYGDDARVYRLETQIDLLSSLTGADTGKAILPHLTPVALVLWLPLAWIGHGSRSVEHAVWIGLSIALYVISTHRLYTTGRERDVARRLGVTMIPLVGLLSFSALTALVLGQSSIFVAALLMMMLLDPAAAGDTERVNAGLVLLLVSLAIKPHFYLWGLAITSVQRHHREIVASLVIVMVILLLLTPRLGWKWPLEYLEIMSIHSQPEPPAYCQDFINLDVMTNFRAAFYEVLGPILAHRASTLTFSLLTLSSAGLGMWKGWFKPKNNRFWTRLTPSALLNSLVGSYLLFSPHLYNYEELLFIPMSAITLLSTRDRTRPLLLFGLIGITAAVINPDWFLDRDYVGLLWGLKATLVIVLIWLSTRPDSTELKPHTPADPHCDQRSCARC